MKRNAVANTNCRKKDFEKSERRRMQIPERISNKKIYTHIHIHVRIKSKRNNRNKRRSVWKKGGTPRRCFQEREISEVEESLHRLESGEPHNRNL